jgi:hypothetical protein
LLEDPVFRDQAAMLREETLGRPAPSELVADLEKLAGV